MGQIRKLNKDQFPPLLLEIPDAPKELYYEGCVPDWSEYKLLTVVGSRKYSTYGADVCKALISGLKGYKIAIVSGLAIGIDSIAHKTALEYEILTIAVPGSGIDRSVLYPRSNRKLADYIIEKGGLILSEYSPLTKAALHTFPRRNRIMAGMSHATLLIEAAERSGTLITAKLATEYNRELLAVPHDITRVTSKGVNKFIKMGAIPVTESEDILEAMSIEFDTNNTNTKLNMNTLSDDERRVINLLNKNPMRKDELIQRLQMDVSQANILLSAMELKELIKEEMSEVRLQI